MNQRYVLLWLEGPLQSWGHDSRFGRRDTLPFPTLSGLCGLICAALGASGEQRELLAALTQHEWEIRALKRVVQKGQKIALPTPLRDFHMVGSGYDERDPWQQLLIPKKSDGSKAVGGGTKMTYRYYLQDCAFAVLAPLEEALANRVADALAAPVWDLSLGRKNCAPTEFIGQGVFATAQAAWQRCDQLAQEKNRVRHFDVRCGAFPDQGDVMTLNDVPLQFGVNKRYRDRLITVVYG